MESFYLLVQEIHRAAVEKGFYDDEHKTPAEVICLMHSELSELLEALRHGNPPSEHIPGFTAEEEEAADVFIRLMDYAGWRGLRIEDAICAKIAFNATREYKHGKEF